MIKLFCKHKNQKWVRNIYGDEINRISTRKIYRSEWKCADCGKTIYHHDLNERTKTHASV